MPRRDDRSHPSAKTAKTVRLAFTRTGERRYGVRADRPGHPAVVMDPAPGYDPLLPHDLVHLVVEEELGIRQGIYGQLAAGGTAGTFRLAPVAVQGRERTRLQRALVRRGARLAEEGRADAELSEQAAAVCHGEWLARRSSARSRQHAREMAPYVEKLRTTSGARIQKALTSAKVDRICVRLERLSARWRALEVGEALELEWS